MRGSSDANRDPLGPQARREKEPLVEHPEERRLLRSSGALILAAILVVAAPSRGAGQEFTNLQVLPTDISRSELNGIMLDNLQGLGLPRRANEGCLFCHVGSMEVPSIQWDWASDEKPMKRKARAMMLMVRDINEEHLSSIERSWDEKVGCYTCHAARTNPMPLSDVLAREYRAGGVEGLLETYRTLRARYFAADAYDFRTPVLAAVADDIAAAGWPEDAAAVHRLNIEYSEDARAVHGLVHLRMTQALDEDGIEAMVDRYHALKDEHPAQVFDPLLLDALGWRLFRSDQEEAGLRLFELNYVEHPDSYTATEDLAYGRSLTGDREGAIALARAWLEEHPDHELGRRLLDDLQRR